GGRGASGGRRERAPRRAGWGPGEGAWPSGVVRGGRKRRARALRPAGKPTRSGAALSRPPLLKCESLQPLTIGLEAGRSHVARGWISARTSPTGRGVGRLGRHEAAQSPRLGAGTDLTVSGAGYRYLQAIMGIRS